MIKSIARGGAAAALFAISDRLATMTTVGTHALFICQSPLDVRLSCTGAGDDEIACRALTDTLKDIEGRGVEVMGIGINTDFGESMYSNWFTVNDLSDLAQTVIDQLAVVLMGKKITGRVRL